MRQDGWVQRLRPLLTGGDRRSIARSREARAIVSLEPRGIAALARLTKDSDWLVAMRALDLLEKLAHERPRLVRPHRRVFIGPLAEHDSWEIRLQIVRALPLLSWTPAEMRRVRSILIANATHPQTFVRTWAVDSLAALAQTRPSLRSAARRYVQDLARSGKKSLQTRVRHILQRSPWAR